MIAALAMSLSSVNEPLLNTNQQTFALLETTSHFIFNKKIL